MSLILHNHSPHRLQGVVFFSTHSFPTYSHILIYIHTHLYLPMFSNLKHYPSCLILPSKSPIPSFVSLWLFFCLLYLQFLPLLLNWLFGNIFKSIPYSTVMVSTITTKGFLNTMSPFSYQSLFSFIPQLVYFHCLSVFIFYSLSEHLQLGFSSKTLLKIMLPVTNWWM